MTPDTNRTIQDWEKSFDEKFTIQKIFVTLVAFKSLIGFIGLMINLWSN